jgi:ABC-type glycerol-3-phosphate transport system substrate-binding protein
MKIQVPRTIGGIAVLALGLATVGCSTTESTDGPTTVTLSTWMYDEPGIGDFWKLVIDEYETTTGNTVEVRNLPINEYSSQLIVEMAAGNPADIIFVPATQLAEVAAIGGLEPIGEALSEAGVTDKLGAPTIDFVTSNDEIVAFPIAGRTLDLLYNEELFSAAGLTGPPTSPDEFLDYARQLTIKDNGQVTQYGASMVNAQEDPTFEMLLMWSIAFGGEFSNGSEPTVNTPEVVEALSFMKTLYDEELIPRGALEDDQRALFANGTSAMEIDGNWQVPFVESIDPARAEVIRAAHVPWDGPATGGPNQVVAVSANSANKEAATEFVTLLASDEIMSQFMNYASNIPLLEGSVPDSILEERPFLQASVDAIGTAHPIAPAGFEDQVSEFTAIMLEAIVSCLQSGVDPQEALDGAQAALEDALLD